MSFNSRNPMPGGSANIRNDSASFEIFNNSDDLFSDTTFAAPGTDHAHNDWSRTVDYYTSGTAFGGCKPPVGEYLPLDTSNSNAQDFEFNVLKISSDRSTTHRVQDSTVATKRSQPVNFRLLRARPGVQLSFSLTYQGHIYGDEPVKRCKKHDECTWCKDHQFNEGFCVISRFRRFHRCELDHKGNPSVVLTPQAEHLDPDGSVEFSVVFACWNSCDIHVRCGKEMTLHIEIMQNGDMKRLEYNIQCCENLGRDAFKDRKRKLVSQSENSQENPSKASKASISSSKDSSTPLPSSKSCQTASSCLPTLLPASSTSTENEKPEDIVVEGLDEEKRDLVEWLVRTIGGTSYRIPHLGDVAAFLQPFLHSHDEGNGCAGLVCGGGGGQCSHGPSS